MQPSNSSCQSLPFSRLQRLVGSENLARLKAARILVCGLGGVGSWAAEACARNAVGCIGLVDFDVVKASNINRQLPAASSTIGSEKLTVMRQRIADINPEAIICPFPMRISPENVADLLTANPPWSCVIDAIDERQAKLALLEECVHRAIPVISSMGAANKLDCSAVTAGDLFDTYGCPMARLLRKNLRKRGIASGITAVYSTELPVIDNGDEVENDCGEDTEMGEKRPMGSISYITAIFGMRCAAEAVQRIIDASSLRRRGSTPPSRTTNDNLLPR